MVSAADEIAEMVIAETLEAIETTLVSKTAIQIATHYGLSPSARKNHSLIKKLLLILIQKQKNSESS